MLRGIADTINFFSFNFNLIIFTTRDFLFFFNSGRKEITIWERNYCHIVAIKFDCVIKTRDPGTKIMMCGLIVNMLSRS